MVTQGVLLTIVEAVLVVFAAVILFIFVGSFATSASTASFGVRCMFTFLQANIENNFLYPLSSELSKFSLGFIPTVSVSSSAVQGACLQQSSTNINSVASAGQQFYGKASACFSLFTGSNAQTGMNVAHDLNNVFGCFSGKIYNSGSVTYGQVINYIDANYNNPSDPLQIVFITNRSNDNATYVDPQSQIVNGSDYYIAYFLFQPYVTTGVLFSQVNCPVNFQDACSTLSTFWQPNSTGPSGQNLCFQNQTSPNSRLPVSSLSNQIQWSNSAAWSAYTTFDYCRQDYRVAFCGSLIDGMTWGQNRVFICVKNP